MMAGNPTGDAAMTEAEWQNSADPQRMLRFVGLEMSSRLLRLFVCAEYRRREKNIRKDSVQDALDISERYADGTATDDELLFAAGMTRFGAYLHRVHHPHS